MSKPRIATDDWIAANPKKFCIFNGQYNAAGVAFSIKVRMPWVATGGDFYREHKTFQDALNYALDMSALI